MFLRELEHDLNQIALPQTPRLDAAIGDLDSEPKRLGLRRLTRRPYVVAIDQCQRKAKYLPIEAGIRDVLRFSESCDHHWHMILLVPNARGERQPTCNYSWHEKKACRMDCPLHYDVGQ